MAAREGLPMQSLEMAIEAQRRFMEIYGEVLEQALSMLVYMVPVQEDGDGRGGDVAAFWNQVVQSVHELFNAYRTALLRNLDAVPVALQSSAGSTELQLRHLRRMHAGTAFVLRALRSVQVLLEMRARQVGGPRRALQVCIFVEAIKLMLKLSLKSKMPFAFYVDEEAVEEVDPPSKRPSGRIQSLEDAQAHHATLEGSTAVGAHANGDQDDGMVQTFVGRRSGRRLRPLTGVRNGDGPVVARTQEGDRAAGANEADVAPLKLCCEDTSRKTNIVLAAEVLFHGRPLAHLLMLARRGPRSWSAWLLTIMMDHISLRLLASQVNPRLGTKAAALEVAEVQRRMGLRWWALLRSPFFDKFLRRWVDVLDNLWKRIPVLNIFNLIEIFLSLQPYYFTTSGT